jgi:iron complex outermembrane receptor protein
VKLALVLCLFSAAAAAAGEAERGTLRGRVADPTDAAVARAAVVATNILTGETVRAESGAEGRYELALRPGTYRVWIAAAGFAVFQRDLVAIGADEATVVDARLQLGALADQVTVTARAADVLESLENRQVRESGARDVGEALTALDGVSKIRKGAIANDVLIRGFQQGTIAVVIDGSRIYGACPNHMDPAAYHVDFAEIQQVEVTKGAFDMRNQGSLGGTVNIVNKTPAAGLRLSPNIAAGSFGYYNPSVTGSMSGESAYALAGASYRRSGPYRDGAGLRFTEYANYKQSALDKDAFDVTTSWFRFGANPVSNHKLELNYTRQKGGLVLYPYLLMDAPYDNADRLGASYIITTPGGPVTQLRIQSYFTRVKHWMTDEQRASSEGAPRPFSMATFAGTKALGGHIEADLFGMVAGVELYRRNWNAVNTMRMAGVYVDQAAIPNVNTSAAGLYALHQRSFGRLDVNAGVRLDAARMEALGNANTNLYWAYHNTRSLARSDANPSASLRLAYALGRGVQVFAGIGRTVRLPDAEERYFALRRGGADWAGNPNLRPTRNTEADAGVNYRTGRLSVRPTLFYSRLTDFINIYNQPRINMLPGVMNLAARSYQNIDARTYGGELGWDLRLTRSLVASGGLAYARGARPGGNLAEIPPLRSRTTLRYGGRTLFLEAEAIAVNAQGRVDAALREARTPGYAVANLKAGIHGSKLNLAGGIGNLFDRSYYEHASYQRDPFRTGARVPEPGRNVFVTVAYGF